VVGSETGVGVSVGVGIGVGVGFETMITFGAGLATGAFHMPVWRYVVKRAVTAWTRWMRTPDVSVLMADPCPM
jgi:hypothetical protein